MAQTSLPQNDPHVAMAAHWRQLLAVVRELAETGDGPGKVLDELFEIEEQMVETPIVSRAGLLALAEIVQYDLTRELPPESFGLLAVAALVAGIAAGL